MIIIYQVVPRLYGNTTCVNLPYGSIRQNGCGKMNDFTTEELQRIRDLGFTHVWYTGLLAHATCTDYSASGIPPCHHATVKGRAGSPYAVRDYYDIDPDLAINVDERLTEFRQLVVRTHAAGLKFVMDFVPNHLAREYKSVMKPAEVEDFTDKNFYVLPGTTLGGEINWGGYVETPAKATGNDCFTPSPTRNDWYETVKLNYTDHDTWEKMLHILLYWASQGVDAFRCDMAEMVTVDFWHWATAEVRKQHPHVSFIAEVYNPQQYRNYLHHGGFDYLYDKVGLYDTLHRIVSGAQSAIDITRCWQQHEDILHHLLHFMENHDEQRIASLFFAGDARKAIPAMIVSACMSASPLMVYAGQELGEPGMDEEGFSGRDGRTSIFDYWSVDTLRRRMQGNLTEAELRLQSFYQRLLRLCNESSALREGGFYDLQYANSSRGTLFNEHRQYVFLRKSDTQLLLVVVNFDGEDARCGVSIPQHAFDHLHLEARTKAEACDLLSGHTSHLDFVPEAPIMLEVPAYGGVIMEIKNQTDS